MWIALVVQGIELRLTGCGLVVLVVMIAVMVVVAVVVGIFVHRQGHKSAVLAANSCVLRPFQNFAVGRSRCQSADGRFLQCHGSVVR